MTADRFIGLKPFSLVADGLVHTGPGYIDNIVVSGSASGAYAVAIHDDLDGTSTAIWACVGTAGAAVHPVSLPVRINVSTGIYVDVTSVEVVCGSYSE